MPSACPQARAIFALRGRCHKMARLASELHRRPTQDPERPYRDPRRPCRTSVWVGTTNVGNQAQQSRRHLPLAPQRPQLGVEGVVSRSIAATDRFTPWVVCQRRLASNAAIDTCS